MVDLYDGSTLAHLGYPDMRVPISYALHYPERAPLPLERLDLAAVGTLSFESVDEENFRCLKIAREAGKAGGTAPCIMNAANEVAVAAFIDGQIDFLQIATVIEATLDAVEGGQIHAFQTLFVADQKARNFATDFIGKSVAS